MWRSTATRRRSRERGSSSGSWRPPRRSCRWAIQGSASPRCAGAACWRTARACWRATSAASRADAPARGDRRSAGRDSHAPKRLLTLHVRVRTALLAALVYARADRAGARAPVRHDAHPEALARQPRDRHACDPVAAHGAAQLAVHVGLDAHDPAVLRLVDAEGEAALVPALDRAGPAAPAPAGRAAPARAGAADRED